MLGACAALPGVFYCFGGQHWGGMQPSFRGVLICPFLLSESPSNQQDPYPGLPFPPWQFSDPTLAASAALLAIDPKEDTCTELTVKPDAQAKKKTAGLSGKPGGRCRHRWEGVGWVG